MGQITQPSSPGITVLPVDRQTGPAAGPGNTGNQTIFLGANAGRNNTQPNIIAIGNGTAAGGMTDPALAGSTFVGVASAPVLVSTPSSFGPSTIIGSGNITLAQQLDASVIIGANNATSVASPDVSLGTLYDDVFIGNGILANQTKTTNQSILIGNNIGVYNGAGFYAELGDLVAIGVQAFGYCNGNGNITSSVAIGYQAALNQNQNSGIDNCIFIGTNCVSGTVGDFQSTYIGASIGNAGIDTIQGNNATFGYGISISGSFNTAIGANAGSGVAWGTQNIAIGAGAGNAIPAGGNYLFDLSTYIGVTIDALLWGNMSNGNLIIGNSRANLDLDTIAATNAVKIFNGTRGAGNPVGGGFFYCSAGALHWVGTAGTDTTIAPA